MNKQFTNSLIISTYNWPNALELCLMSLLQQKMLPDEVLIADDGSKEVTKNIIDKYREKFSVPVEHVWQPDEGFQLAKIRNKAIAKAKGDYIIQIDGDLILHPYFMNDHLSHAEEGHFVTGSRILLQENLTSNILDNKRFNFGWFLPGSKNFFNGLRSKILREFLSKRYKMSGKNKYYVKGCNMAFWKKDLIAVNGYNEDFTGWGKEDSEIAIRLMNAGIMKKFIKMGAVVYHLYHHEASRHNEKENFKLMEVTIMKNIKGAEKGVGQYL